VGINVSEGASITVVALFGILFGVSLQVFAVVGNIRARRGRSLDHQPRSFWVSTTVVYAIIALLILTVHFTPVQMHWVPFIVSTFVGYSVMAIIFRVSRSVLRRDAEGQKGST
jgi:hypothetical protein